MATATSGKRALRPAITLTALALTATLWASATATSEQTERLTRTLPIPRTLPIALGATVGDITVVGWDRPEVHVEIVRSASSAAQLAGIAISIQTNASDARVAAVQTDGQKDGRLRGSIIVRAPADQAFGDIQLFEGRISLRGLRGGVRALVEHGSIEAASLAGAIRLETRIGSVRLERAELSERGTIRLRTFNGDVALGFASTPAHARILALSLGGTIHSDIPLTLKTQFGPRFGETTLGRGEPVVSIDVVQGHIRITSGKA